MCPKFLDEHSDIDMRHDRRISIDHKRARTFVNYKSPFCWPGLLSVLCGDPRRRHSGQDQGPAPGHRGQRAETPGRGEAGPAGATCAPDQVTCRGGSRGCGHTRPLPRRVPHPRGLRPGQILLSGSRTEMCQRLHSSRKYWHHLKVLNH